jgi:hypothetical protein
MLKKEPRRTNGREETLEETGRQQWHKEPPQLWKGRKTANSIGAWSRRQQLRLESVGNGNEIFGNTIGLGIMKRVAGSSVRL